MLGYKRIRVKLLHLFFSKMHKDSSRAGTITSRRCSSSADLPAPSRLISRGLIRSQRSFEIYGMQPSGLRLLGTCARSMDVLHFRKDSDDASLLYLCYRYETILPRLGRIKEEFNYLYTGARPPPLIRRSSFPTPQAKQAATSSLCGTPTHRLTRRQSAESDEEIKVVTNALHHRIRLIRRH